MSLLVVCLYAPFFLWSFFDADKRSNLQCCVHDSDQEFRRSPAGFPRTEILVIAGDAVNQSNLPCDFDEEGKG